MRFKKIYIEVTNRCNLKCDFCVLNSRKIKDISISEFETILNKITGYTEEIYLHVLGEPLLHPYINELIKMAKEKGIDVNITTNGYLIDKLKVNPKRVNISLHSYNKKYKISLYEYLDKIFNYIDLNKDKTYFSLRLWARNKDNINIINYINKRYNLNLYDISSNKKIKIGKNLLIDTFHEFIWPRLDNNYYNELGRCYGLINHIGILSDGTIIPCCLDSKGIINLGNIYKDNLDKVLNSDIVKNMINGFKNNKKYMELCRHCSFLEESNDNKI